MLVPGFRRDRGAWEWRVAIVGAFAVWALVWGTSFMDQLGRPHSTWIPHTTPSYLATTLNELVDSFPSLRWLVLPLVIAGCWLAGRRGPSGLGRVIVCCGVVPVALAALIGMREHFLLARSLAFLSWVPLLGLAFIVAEAFERWRLLGLAALGLAGVLVVPSTIDALSDKQPSTAAAIVRVGAVARDGDAVAVHPPWLRPLSRWYFGVRRPGDERVMTIDDLDADVLMFGDGPWNGRVWLIEPITYHATTNGYDSCAPTWARDGFRVHCLVRRPAS